ncbi:sigma-54-dependent transcriptional regulator [Aliamphritea hakodatensis]|uniref:sigma-54-dependent transcriptional regulator n=1 Tax=Aliamphritea hakodatensis TaxID=2895352 RepID=UPI0022FD94EE|nr:sigma-54 dependent transcriptional regulator [Aliamphritea hakodatensis]
MNSILIVDDDHAICRTLEIHFGSIGHQVAIRHSVEEGLEWLNHNSADVLVLDIRMAGLSGLEGLPMFKALQADLRIIMITAYHDMATTIEAMQNGADEYIHKPLDLDEIDAAVASALKYRQQQNSDGIEVPQATVFGKYDLVGSSAAMRTVFKTIGRVADTSASVLITGESGTGKEVVARAIHNASSRRDQSFVAINCAALVENLLESEMFGHKRGAFTGAVKDQLGKFELADKGTLFLDEVGELSPGIQAKLLRVLQDREYIPLGAENVRYTDARIIAATNADLNLAMQEGRFREDLFYRLQIVNLHLPPLRERSGDLVELVQNLMTRSNREMGRSVNRISVEAMACLNSYHWPGNIRELQNLLTKAVALCNGEVLTADLLPEHLTRDVPPHEGAIGRFSDPHSTKNLSLQEIERHHVEQVLESTGWHKGQTCDILGVSRPRLQRMISNYGIQEPE